MMEKVDVKEENMNLVYKWLTSKKLNGVTLVGTECSKEKPDSDKKLAWLSAK
ncbi:MAG: hypothetical protein WCE64_11055 [Bacteroidales bacterium]